MTSFVNKNDVSTFLFFNKIIQLFILFQVAVVSDATPVQMRVVKDTASYGYFGHNVGETENNQLTPTVLPANFSGPQLLKKLIGKCYNLTQDQYRYTFCPFQNFSQYELSSRWNAYHGILGVWSHWNIENNTFISMVYNHGDPCGSIERSVKIYLQCGPVEYLVNVTEPNKCSYSAVFHSRYICHKDSLLVYPRLSSKLQRKWDELLTEFHNGDITEKGYYSGLQNIFQLAGFLEAPISELPPKTTEASTLAGSIFTDLDICNKEYKTLATEISRLNLEIESLKLLLDLSKVGNKTTKPPH